MEDQLYDAAYQGDFEKVLEILHSGYAVDINCRHHKGNTPLYIAAAWGYGNHFLIVKKLIEEGANINIPNFLGQTPLYVAASWGHAHVVKYLIDNGADLEFVMEEGRTALLVAACSKPHVNNFRYGNYARFSKKFMFHAAKRFMEYVMQTGQYPQLHKNVKDDYVTLQHFPINQVKNVPDEIMDIVVFYNHFNTVAVLVNAGANIHHQNLSGDTVLNIAQTTGHVPMVEFLLENGAKC